MSMNLVTLMYLIASVCFIQALKGLSHPTTSIRGNVFGMTGMAIAVVTTAALIFKLAGEAGNSGVGGLAWVLLGLLAGGGLGAYMAQKVEMTKMPELVAFMHSMIGMAAVFIAISAVAEPHAFAIVAKALDPIPAGNRLELALGMLGRGIGRRREPARAEDRAHGRASPPPSSGMWRSTCSAIVRRTQRRVSSSAIR